MSVETCPKSMRRGRSPGVWIPMTGETIYPDGPHAWAKTSESAAAIFERCAACDARRVTITAAAAQHLGPETAAAVLAALKTSASQGDGPEGAKNKDTNAESLDALATMRRALRENF